MAGKAVRDGQERTVAVKKGNGAWRARKFLGADSFAGVARVLKSQDTTSDRGTAPRTDKEAKRQRQSDAGHGLVHTAVVNLNRGAYGRPASRCLARVERDGASPEVGSRVLDPISRRLRATVLTWFLCSGRTILEMSTPVRGRPAKPLPGLSELAVGRVTAAVHGALVCRRSSFTPRLAAAYRSPGGENRMACGGVSPSAA